MIMQNVEDIRQYFVDELEAENFTTDRTGAKTIELLGASFIANENAIFGSPNEDYIQKELEWYDSESTNIYDISSTPPQAWKMTANHHGEINHNPLHVCNWIYVVGTNNNTTSSGD